MTGKTHDLSAFAALMTVAVYYPPTQLSAGTAISALIANIVGAKLPDLDQASNRLWDLLPGGNMMGKILRNLFLAHRTITHSILGVFLVYKVLIWLVPMVFNGNFIDSRIIIWAMMIGYLTHLAGDSLTEEGLPILFPIKWKFGIPPIRRMRMKTGRWFEKWVVFPAIIIYILGFGFWYWAEIWAIIKLAI